MECADTIGDAVGADFAWIVGEDGQAGFDAGLDEKRLLAEVAIAKLAKDPVDGRDDGGNDTAADGGGVDILALDEASDENALLVGSLAGARADAPGRAEVAGMALGRERVEGDHGVGVVDVEDDAAWFDFYASQDAAGENGAEACGSTDLEEATGVEGRPVMPVWCSPCAVDGPSCLPRIQEEPLFETCGCFGRPFVCRRAGTVSAASSRSRDCNRCEM